MDVVYFAQRGIAIVHVVQSRREEYQYVQIAQCRIAMMDNGQFNYMVKLMEPFDR
jgi:hypothetical protein